MSAVPRSHGPLQILVVSQDPRFILSLQDRYHGGYLEVYGCLGPAQTPCLLEAGGTCPLAAHADVVLVDAPPSGAFVEGPGVTPVGAYATRLARVHPQLFVVVCGAPLGTAGPGGEVAHVRDRQRAVVLLDWLSGSVSPQGQGRSEKEMEGSRI